MISPDSHSPSLQSKLLLEKSIRHYPLLFGTRDLCWNSTKWVGGKKKESLWRAWFFTLSLPWTTERVTERNSNVIGMCNFLLNGHSEIYLNKKGRKSICGLWSWWWLKLMNLSSSLWLKLFQEWYTFKICPTETYRGYYLKEFTRDR